MKRIVKKAKRDKIKKTIKMIFFTEKTVATNYVKSKVYTYIVEGNSKVGTMKNMETNKLRVGQKAFNDFAEKYPELVEKITGTEFDPFYDDSKIESFYLRVNTLLNLRTK